MIDRSYYPGWNARIDGGPPRPVTRADGGLIAVRLDGAGTTHVAFAYRPGGLWPAAAVSSVAVVAALATLILDRRSFRAGR